MSTVMPWRRCMHNPRDTAEGVRNLTGTNLLQVSILEELSMAGGLLTQSELHAMLTRAKRYRDMPLPERAATLEDIRRTLLGLRTRCESGRCSNSPYTAFSAPLPTWLVHSHVQVPGSECSSCARPVAAAVAACAAAASSAWPAELAAIPSGPAATATPCLRCAAGTSSSIARSSTAQQQWPGPCARAAAARSSHR